MFLCSFLLLHKIYSICQRTKFNYSSILKLSSGTSSSFFVFIRLFPSFFFRYLSIILWNSFSKNNFSFKYASISLSTCYLFLYTFLLFSGIFLYFFIVFLPILLCFFLLCYPFLLNKHICP